MSNLIYIYIYCKTSLIDSSTWVSEENVSKFDENGNINWRTPYAIGQDDYYRDFEVLSDGSSLVTGFWAGTQNDMYLVRIDRDGNTLYESQYYEFGYQFNRDMEIANDGSIWHSAYQRPFATFDYNAFMLKVDSDGNVIKKDTIPDPYPSDIRSVMFDFDIAPDGNIICFWGTDANGSYIMKMDSNYNILWQTPEVEVYDPILLDNGTIFVMGDNKVKLFSYNNGVELWSHAYTDYIRG